MGQKNILMIGAGGVAHVAAHKAAMHNDMLGDICIASRTLAKCEAIIDSEISPQSSQSFDGNIQALKTELDNASATIHIRANKLPSESSAS
jgi:saccharopine dehydrogenase-like NADP-dependent oxidoreductase